jgi:phosphoribosyl-AMP cyclohydrolase
MAKGDTYVHYVKSLSLNCDADAVGVKVDQMGAACHTRVSISVSRPEGLYLSL